MLKLRIEHELEEAGFKFASFYSERYKHCYILGAIRIHVYSDGRLLMAHFGDTQHKTQQEIEDFISNLREEQ